MIFPTILSGGSGSRLWPLSHAQRPKQFAPLVSDRSMIAETATRFEDQTIYAAPLIVGSQAHKDLLAEEATRFPIAPQSILLEPIARNTAPAITAAALALSKAHGDDALMLILPADHAIADHAAFHKAINIAAQAAQTGALVTFGIVPTEPHTGYGYIKAGPALPDHEGAFSIAAFVEKPDLDKAKTYLASGDYAWNSGMFLFRAGSLLEEMTSHHPRIVETVSNALDAGQNDGVFTLLDETHFAASDAISIDYAVMECTRQGAVVPADLGWSDIGAWTALTQFATPFNDDNHVLGNAALFTHGTQDCFVSSTQGRPIAVIGAQDLIIVDTAEGLLIVHKDQAQDVKHAADHFRTHKS